LALVFLALGFFVRGGRLESGAVSVACTCRRISSTRISRSSILIMRSPSAAMSSLLGMFRRSNCRAIWLPNAFCSCARTLDINIAVLANSSVPRSAVEIVLNSFSSVAIASRRPSRESLAFPPVMTASSCTWRVGILSARPNDRKRGRAAAMYNHCKCQAGREPACRQNNNSRRKKCAD